MDEMEEYRNGIEHRYGDRRRKKNERRHGRRKEPTPFDWLFFADLLLLVGMTVALYYLN